ncbi:MAG: MBL fold metallo-hydrolase [Ruminococcus sp.]|nr:MBL fold metallo-hydrolase [Ruminococcus sp.]
MNIKNLQLGEIHANCYIAVTAPEQCVAVDIGGTPRLLIEYLKMNRLKLTKILLTHGHFDHMNGVEEVRLATGAEVFIHEKDADMLSSSSLSLHAMMSIMPFNSVSEYKIIHDGDIISDGNCEFKVLHTPGHSKGSVCYICDDERVIFSGDTLFCCSVGRTDFSGSNPDDMIKSLERLYNLNGDYKVLPGHMESTTLDYERQNNPYMRRFRKP